MPIKRIHIVFLLMAIGLMACPRVQKMPERANIGGFQMFDYAGMQVLHQYSARDYVHVRLHFDWANTFEFPKNTQLLAVETAFFAGAGEFSAREYAAKIENAGANLQFLAEENGPVIRLNCLPARLPQAWKLLSLALEDPRFEREAFLDLRAARAAANSAKITERKIESRDLAQKATWPNEWQAEKNAEKTIENVSSTVSEQIFRSVMRQRCRMRWVIAGPIEAEKILDLMLETTEALPEGACADDNTAAAVPTWQVVELKHETHGFGVATGILSAPSANEQAAWPMRMLAEILRQRFQQKLVEKDRVAQQVDCYYEAASPAHIVLQVMGKNAFQGSEFMLSELRKAKELGFSDAEVEAARNVVLAQLALGYEAAPNLAKRLDEVAAQGSVNWAGNEQLLLMKVKPKTLQNLAKQYFQNITWGLVGDTTNVERKSLFKL